MIEGHGAGEIAGLHDGYTRCVIVGARGAGGACDIDSGHGESARIPSRCRVKSQKAQELDVEAGLFSGFPYCARLHVFVRVEHVVGEYMG